MASASDFAKLLLGLTRGGLPIVFEKLKVPVIGGRPKLLLRQQPDRLGFLTCCTAKTERGSNTNNNLKEQLFLDVEWDHLPTEQQLSLLLYLCKDRGWPLVTITHSGSKSLHAFFWLIRTHRWSTTSGQLSARGGSAGRTTTSLSRSPEVENQIRWKVASLRQTFDATPKTRLTAEAVLAYIPEAPGWASFDVLFEKINERREDRIGEKNSDTRSGC